MTLKEFRTDRGMSQGLLGKKLGVSYQLISHYENGRQTPSLKVKQEFKRQFGAYKVPIMDYTEDELKEINTKEIVSRTMPNYKSVNAPAKPPKLEPKLRARLPVSVNMEGKEEKVNPAKEVEAKLEVGEEMALKMEAVEPEIAPIAVTEYHPDGSMVRKIRNDNITYKDGSITLDKLIDKVYVVTGGERGMMAFVSEEQAKLELAERYIDAAGYGYDVTEAELK